MKNLLRLLVLSWLSTMHQKIKNTNFVRNKAFQRFIGFTRIFSVVEILMTNNSGSSNPKHLVSNVKREFFNDGQMETETLKIVSHTIKISMCIILKVLRFILFLVKLLNHTKCCLFLDDNTYLLPWLRRTGAHCRIQSSSKTGSIFRQLLPVSNA